MSKTFSVTVGKAYLIRAAGGSTITTEAGVTVATIPEEGTQTTVLAPVDTLVISDDNARVQQLIYGIATKGSSSTNLLETDNTWLGVNTYSNTIKIEAGNNIQFYSPTAGTSCNLFMNSHGDIVQLGTSSNNCAFNVVTNSYVSLYGNQSAYLTSGDYLTGGGYIVEAASSSAGIYANGRNNQYIKFTKNASDGNDLAIKASTTNFYGNVDFTRATVTGLSGVGDITAAGDNTFTGYNTFNGGTKFNGETTFMAPADFGGARFRSAVFVGSVDFTDATVTGLSGGGSGDVTAAGDNTFTGYNTFNNGGTKFIGLTDFRNASVIGLLELGFVKESGDNTFTGNNKFEGGAYFYSHVDFTHATVMGLSGGGSGDVTATGDNTFTGTNSFEGAAYFSDHVDFTNATVLGVGNVTASGSNTFTGENTFNGMTYFSAVAHFLDIAVAGAANFTHGLTSDGSFNAYGECNLYNHLNIFGASSASSAFVRFTYSPGVPKMNVQFGATDAQCDVIFVNRAHFAATSYIDVQGTIDFTYATVIGLHTAQSLIITDEETNSLNIGTGSVAEGKNSLALGTNALANSDGAQTIGSYSRNSNSGCTVLNAFNSTSVTPTGAPANGSELVQLYIMAPNSPLANTYCDGEAGLGFITASYSSGAWTISSSGTKKLSELLNDNINVFSPDVSQSVATVNQK